MGKNRQSQQIAARSTEQAVAPAEHDAEAFSEEQGWALEIQEAYGNQAVVGMLGAGSGGAAPADTGGGPSETGIATGAGSATPGVRASANHYTVRRGDTLSGIAAAAGQADYTELYNLNRDLIMGAEAIRTGCVLVLPEGWIVPGMVNGPNRLTGDPLALANTEYADPDLGLGVQVDPSTGAQEKVQPHTTGDTVEGARTVKLVSETPVQLPGAGKPAESQLFVEDPAGFEIERQRGTLDKPETFRAPLDESMYIGGAPQVADVNQGGIGDCYFLSAVLGVVGKDPGKITDMMSYADGRATVEFFRKDGAGWVAATVVVTNDLMVMSADTTDLQGADLRVANQPTRSDWSATRYEKELTVTKAEFYEWALWAPLLEKAYARFSEQYGRYGDAATAATGSGYDRIDGGFNHQTFGIFYGAEVTRADAEQINYDPDGDLIGDNMASLARLVQFSEQKDHPGPGGGEQTFLSLQIGADESIERCEEMLDAVLKEHDPWFWEKDTLTPALTALKATITTWKGAKNEVNRQAVVDEVKKVFAAGAHPELTDPTAEPVFGHLWELLAVVVNLGTDDALGRRNVYAGHSYNVTDIAWAFTGGPPMAVSTATLPLVAPLIDPMTTQVIIENPHATNEPDLDGNGPDSDANDEGRFTMSLDQVFRNFTWIEQAVVDHAPN